MAIEELNKRLHALADHFDPKNEEHVAEAEMLLEAFGEAVTPILEWLKSLPGRITVPYAMKDNPFSNN